MKPLKDWTLGEIYEECASHHDDCKFNGVCPFKMSNVLGSCRIRIITSLLPDSWDLSESPRWTEQDVKDAKALKRLIADAHHVWRGAGQNDKPQLYDEYENQMWILNDCFAALPPRTNVTLDEIIGGAE